MAYQPYPTGGGSNRMAAAGGQPQPMSLRNAVRLMWVGAGLALLSAVTTFAFSGRLKTAVTNAAVKANATAARQGKTQLTAAQIHTLANATVVAIAAFGIIGVMLWVWMAWANNKGRSWARTVATVLFALNTVSLIFSAGRAGISFVFIVVAWLVGLGAIVLLWQRASSDYINSQSHPR